MYKLTIIGPVIFVSCSVLLAVDSHFKNDKILSIYIPNISVTNFIKRKLVDVKSRLIQKTEIVGDFSLPLLPTDRPLRENKWTEKNKN